MYNRILSNIFLAYNITRTCFIYFIFSEVLSSATECLTELFESIESELKVFCNQSNWLIQLNEYISTWEGRREGGEGFRTIKPEDIKVIDTLECLLFI